MRHASEDTPILPAHSVDTVRSIAELQAEHDRQATLYQRTIVPLMGNLGRPAFGGVIVVVMVSDQKIAKLIELIEHQGRDNPHMHDRIDEEAAKMATPTDPQAILEAIKETHSESVANDAMPAFQPSTL